MLKNNEVYKKKYKESKHKIKYYEKECLNSSAELELLNKKIRGLKKQNNFYLDKLLKLRGRHGVKKEGEIEKRESQQMQQAPMRPQENNTMMYCRTNNNYMVAPGYPMNMNPNYYPRTETAYIQNITMDPRYNNFINQYRPTPQATNNQYYNNNAQANYTTSVPVQYQYLMKNQLTNYPPHNNIMVNKRIDQPYRPPISTIQHVTNNTAYANPSPQAILAETQRIIDRTKIRRVQPVPLDEKGNFKLPIQLGIFTVLNLGTIEYQRATYHNQRYLFPIGFKIQRYYKSTIDPNKNAIFTLEILEGGNLGPKFSLSSSDSKEIFEAETLSGAWGKAVKLANSIRSIHVNNSGSGPELSGFAHSTICFMLQSLPNADKCHNYHWQTFEPMAKNNVPVNKGLAPPIPK